VNIYVSRVIEVQAALGGQLPITYIIEGNMQSHHKMKKKRQGCSKF
jgi:hypothetical protein